MKSSSWVRVAVVAAVVLGLVAAGFGIDSYIRVKTANAVAQERIRAAEIEKAGLNASIAARDEALVANQAAMARMDEESKRREAVLQAQLASVQSASPQQLVDVGSQILDVTDIRSDGLTVQMSVETYRKIVFTLVEHRDFVNVKVPEWAEKDANYRAQISTYKANEADYQRRELINNGIIKDLRDVISGTKQAGLFEKAAWAAGGFALGVISEKIR